MSKTPRTTTVPVSLAAVVKRIKRKLAKEGKALTANRFISGGFFIVDGKNIVHESASIRMLAQNLGVLKPWESIQ